MKNNKNVELTNEQVIGLKTLICGYYSKSVMDEHFYSFLHCINSLTADDFMIKGSGDIEKTLGFNPNHINNPHVSLSSLFNNGYGELSSINIEYSNKYKLVFVVE